jgi:hypothetical protein
MSDDILELPELEYPDRIPLKKKRFFGNSWEMPQYIVTGESQSKGSEAL